MKRIKTLLVFIILISPVLFTMTSCKSCGRNKGADLPPGTHCVGVIEVVQTTNYTYLRVEENDNEFWIAVERREAKTGDVLYYTKAGEMKNFYSRELNRTFSSVFFVEDPSDTLVTAKSIQPKVSTGRLEIKRKPGISVNTAKGGISISDLYKNQSDYSEKPVKIRGVVVKFNKQIMNKNWVHIQDGTDYSGKYDLTVTTLDSVEVGSTVTFTGIIRLNKDFGAGYKYDVIMEEAKVSDIEPAME